MQRLRLLGCTLLSRFSAQLSADTCTSGRRHAQPLERREGHLRQDDHEVEEAVHPVDNANESRCLQEKRSAGPESYILHPHGGSVATTCQETTAGTPKRGNVENAA